MEFCCYLHFLTEVFKNSYDISFDDTFLSAKTDGSGISAEKFQLELWSGKQTALPYDLLFQTLKIGKKKYVENCIFYIKGPTT